MRVGGGAATGSQGWGGYKHFCLEGALVFDHKGASMVKSGQKMQ